MGSIPVTLGIIFFYIYYIFVLSFNIITFLFNFLWALPYYYLLFLIAPFNIIILILFNIKYLICESFNIVNFNLEYIFSLHYFFILSLYCIILTLIFFYYFILLIIKNFINQSYLVLLGWFIFTSLTLGLLWSFQIYQIEYWWSIYDWAENTLLIIYLFIIFYYHYKIFNFQKQLVGFLSFNILFILIFIDINFFYVIHSKVTWLNTLLIFIIFIAYYFILITFNYNFINLYCNKIKPQLFVGRRNIIYLLILLIFFYFVCFNFNNYIIFIDLIDYIFIYIYIFLAIGLHNNPYFIIVIIFYFINITYWFIDGILVFNSILFFMHLIIFKFLLIIFISKISINYIFYFTLNLTVLISLIYIFLLITAQDLNK